MARPPGRRGQRGRDGTTAPMAPATVNNHLAHLSALFSWITVHAPAGLLRHGDPTKKVDLLRLPAPQVRALAGPQVRTVKNMLDRIEGFHQLNGRRHRGGGRRPRCTGTPGRYETGRSSTSSWAPGCAAPRSPASTWPSLTRLIRPGCGG